MRSKNPSRASVTLGPRRYKQVLGQLRPALVAVLGCSAIVNVLMLTGSLYMVQIYDRVLPSGSTPTLIALFAIVAILYCFLGLYDFLRLRMLSRAALTLDDRLGLDIFRASLGGSGSPLKSLATLRSALSSPAATAVFDLPYVPLFLVALFILHPWLGWAAVAGSAIGLVVALVNRKVTRGPMEAAAIHDGLAHRHAKAATAEVETISAMGMQLPVALRWWKEHRAALSAAQAGSDPSEAFAAASRAFRLFLQSVILTLAAFLVIRGELSPGMIVASSILAGRSLAPIDQVIGQWRTLARALSAHRSLRAYFETVLEAHQPVDLPAPQGALSLRNVVVHGSIAAGSEKKPILDGISFDLRAGDALGVVGNSASGKSSLARVIVGALKLDAGEIRIDGATPDQWDPEILGRSIGYLPQKLELLPGTVRDNIARFDPRASDRDVISAAKLVGVHQMILDMPQGYATRIGESGSIDLSGGQTQRLGLARAVFGMPSIVVLDEPNSNLDPAGESALVSALEALRANGSTVIVMAHRPSALTAVNQLLVMVGGRIGRMGDKDEVLGLKPEPLKHPVAPEAQPDAAQVGEALPLPLQELVSRKIAKVEPVVRRVPRTGAEAPPRKRIA